MMKERKEKSNSDLGFTVIRVILVLLLSCLLTSCGKDANSDEDMEKVSRNLVLVNQPEDFAPGNNEISSYYSRGKEGVGSAKFLIFPKIDGIGYNLNAFTQDCSISDLSWMMTKIYNQQVSPKIRSGANLNAMDIALIELSLQVHLAYIHTATSQFLLGAFDSLSDVKDLQASYYLHCFGGSRFWDKSTTDTINTLCLRWYDSARGKMAKTIGECFHGCDHDWLLWALSEISKESSPDIRWRNLVEDPRGMLEQWLSKKAEQMVFFNFDNANTMNLCWKEIHTSIYFESVSAVRRINKEITTALSRVHDVDGYPELHALIEEWRPRMKVRVSNYCVCYSDLPLVVLNKAAYDQTTVADKTFSTDRPLVRKIAQQYTRAAVDGAMHQFAVSATSGSLTSQYHGYLKSLLGSDDYQTFVNSIKWRKSDPLKEE